MVRSVAPPDHVPNVLSRVAAALRADPEHARVLIDALQDPLAVVAQDRELLEVSDAFCALVGLRREELVGARPPYPHWHPDRSAEMSAVLDARLAVGRSEDVVTFWHRDEGREVHVTVTRAPLHDDAGDLVGHVVAMRDVTARVEAERVAARRTAELALGTDRAGKLMFDGGLKEIAHGEWEGLLASEIAVPAPIAAQVGHIVRACEALEAVTQPAPPRRLAA